MKAKTIEVIVHPDGSLRIEAMGFRGADCEKATEFLERALGVAGVRRRKPEYYEAVLLKKQQKLATG